MSCFSVVEISEMVVAWLGHRCLNIWVLSRSVLHSAMWLKSATAALDLGVTWRRLSVFTLVLLKLVLVIWVHFIVCSHWTMSLICFRSLIWIWALFLDLHVLNFLGIWITIFPIILSVKISWILQRRPITIVIYFVIVLSSLRSLVALLILIGALSSRWIIDAVFVLFVLFIVGDGGAFFVLVGIANVGALVWRLIVVNLDDTSLVWCCSLLTKYFNLAVDATRSTALLFFIFINQTLDVIILWQICCYLTVFRPFIGNVAWCRNEIVWLLAWSIDGLNVAIVFNIKIMCNLLRITHILSSMRNRLLLLLLRRSVLLLHL